MNKKWSVGSLIPGRETIAAPRRQSAETSVQAAPVQEQPAREQHSDAAAEVKLTQGAVSCTVPLSPGSTLLDAALAQGCGIQYKCKKGTCGQCAVDITAGAAFLSPRNEAEQKKLGTSPKRLACQSIMNAR